MIRSLLWVALFALPFYSSAQSADDLPSDVLHAYFGKQLEMIPVTAGFTPPVASRAMGYSGLTAYEAVVHGMSDHNSLAGNLPDLDVLPTPDDGVTYYWPEVANQALYLVTAEMYSNASADDLDDLEQIRSDFELAHAIEASAQVVSDSQDFGFALAMAIIAYAELDEQDGCQFTNFPEDYVVPEGDGLWTPLDGQMALQPYWGDKRCFVVPFVTNDMIAEEPPVFSTDPESDLYAEALAVYNAVNNLTTDQQNIAEFWADGGGTVTPPGHSFSMLRNIMLVEEESLAFAAEAYGRMGLALSDAFVQCWKTKYTYNLLRPIQYIKENIDPDFETVVQTPPFPEYTSGHSSQSGAWGSVMTAIYGTNYAFTDSTHGELYGGPRDFDNFLECAEETAVSRLYGGIHYPVGNNNGSSSGQMIGDMVNALFDQLVSVEETAVLNNLQVYPNPSSGLVNFVVGTDAPLQLSVMDITGKLVYQERLYNKQVSLEHLEPGSYVLTIMTTDQQAFTSIPWIRK